MADFTPTTILDTPIVLGTSQGTQEVQKVDFTPQTTGKAATLELDGAKTANLKPKAEVTGANLKTALEALPNVGPVGSGQTYELVSVTVTSEVATITFAGKDGNVPTIVAAAAEGTAPTVTTVTQGELPAEAVAKGFGQADATGRVQPRNSGESPKSIRAANAGTYGD